MVLTGVCFNVSRHSLREPALCFAWLVISETLCACICLLAGIAALQCKPLETSLGDFNLACLLQVGGLLFVELCTLECCGDLWGESVRCTLRDFD